MTDSQVDFAVLPSTLGTDKNSDGGGRWRESRTDRSHRFFFPGNKREAFFRKIVQGLFERQWLSDDHDSGTTALFGSGESDARPAVIRVVARGFDDCPGRHERDELCDADFAGFFDEPVPFGPLIRAWQRTRLWAGAAALFVRDKIVPSMRSGVIESIRPR